MANFFFIVPLRNRDTAQDWDRCVNLCEQTLNSASRQTVHEKVIVILVCNEFPNVRLPANVMVLRLSFPNPAATWEEQHHDKYAKIKAGLVHARSFSDGGYFMKLDADDLVSNRLAEWILTDDNQHGYYVNSGYRWHNGSKYVEPVRHGFHSGCGSSNVLYASRDQLPVDTGDRGRYDLLQLGHNITVETFEKRGQPLTAIPFPGVIYRLSHGENITTHFSPKETHSHQKPNWRFFAGKYWSNLKRASTLRSVNTRIREEFRLPTPQAYSKQLP